MSPKQASLRVPPLVSSAPEPWSTASTLSTATDTIANETIAQVAGLNNMQEMNGQQCQVLNFDESSGNYALQFLDGEGGHGKLRAQNILTLEAAGQNKVSDLNLPSERAEAENEPARLSLSKSATTFTIALGSTGAAVQRLPSTPLTSFAVDQQSPLGLPPSPNLSSAPRLSSPFLPRFAWSYIFDCSNQTEGECLGRRLFGAPASSLSDMERYNLGKDTPLFLRNVRKRCRRI
jgi:hypothetical protein